MLSAALVVLVAASGVFARPDPTTPSPSDSYIAGGQCDIAWTVDTNKTVPWKVMNIQLMTGINSQMTAMRTVATVDATTTTSFNWTCPVVNPPAPIYFYQFTSPDDFTPPLWTGRFLIKATDGSSVGAPLTDPNGVPYGIGVFADPSLYNAPPAYLKGNGQLVGSAGNSTTTSSGTGASTSAGTATTTSTGSTSPSNTASVTKITSSTISSTSTSTSSAHTTTSSGAASASFVSSSWSAVFGALMAVVAVAI